MVDRWPAHRGTGDCPVACGVDLALVSRSPPLSGAGGPDRADPYTDTPPILRAHSGGGGRPTGVWWWDHGQCWGSDVRHGVVPVLWQRDRGGEDTGADQNRRGHGSHRSKRSGDARAMQVRCKGATPAIRGGPRGPYPGSHTDQELT